MTKKKYKSDSSVLYRMPTKKKLFSELRITKEEANNLANSNEGYVDFFSKKKKRLISRVEGKRKYVHTRIRTLLSRIETPDYLHSCTLKRSSVTNAKVHKDCTELFKLDLKKFFPSVKFFHIFKFFHEEMGCPKDVASLISNMCTRSESGKRIRHLPTGSTLSMHLAFFSSKSMFDELAKLADMNGLRMTCFVDDITFSGLKIPKGFSLQVKRIIYANNLKVNKKKIFSYKKNQSKNVTGVIITRGKEFKIPNKKLLEIFNIFKKLKEEPNMSETFREKLLLKLKGRLNYSKQIDPEVTKKFTKIN